MPWGVEIGYGLLNIFKQPLLYIIIAFSFWTSYRRIIADRKMFGHRVFPRHAEWRKTWLSSIISGIYISVIFVLAGITISYEWIILFSAVVFIFALFNQVQLLSPAYTVSIVVLTLYLLNEFNISHPLLERAYTNELVISFLLIFLLIAEAVLLLTTNRMNTFPQLHKSDRGKFIGSHLAKRLKVIPVFIPIPNGLISLDFINWWPIFNLGAESFSFMLVPFLLGFSQRFQGVFSDIGAKRAGGWLLGLIFVLIGLVIGSYYIPELTLAVFIVAIFGRLAIQLFMRFSDKEKRSIYSPRTDGIMVVGVIPKSPADEMGILVGEVIEKIHDIPVTNEYEFFEVMSEHRTFCKMTLRDLNGELRFVQRPLYEGDLHELGLIFVKEIPRFKLMTEKI